MGWKFWKRDQTEAERSLADLQEQAGARTQSAPLTRPDLEPAIGQPGPPDPLMEQAEAHMLQVTADVEAILGPGLDPAREPEFMLEVTAVEPRPDGTVALRGGATEGTAAAEVVVAVLVLPVGTTHLEGDDDDPETGRRLAEALLGARAVRATVVSWDPTTTTLVVAGPGPDEITVGAMVSR